MKSILLFLLAGASFMFKLDLCAETITVPVPMADTIVMKGINDLKRVNEEAEFTSGPGQLVIFKIDAPKLPEHFTEVRLELEFKEKYTTGNSSFPSGELQLIEEGGIITTFGQTTFLMHENHVTITSPQLLTAVKRWKEKNEDLGTLALKLWLTGSDQELKIYGTKSAHPPHLAFVHNVPDMSGFWWIRAAVVLAVLGLILWIRRT